MESELRGRNKNAVFEEGDDASGEAPRDDAMDTDAAETPAAPAAPAPRPGMERRPVVYPLYVTKGKSVREGRKVNAEIAVENPSAQEILEVCEHLGLKAELETYKCHPKDWGVFGRVRVDLKDPETKACLHDTIRTRKQLLDEVCRVIPTLKSRTDPPTPQQQQQQLLLQQQLAMQQAGMLPPQAAPPPQPQKSGKKGKKGRQ